MTKTPLKIIFQNDHFVVVDKAAGVLTTPPRFKDERPILGRDLEAHLQTQIFPVHRLDFEVSGLVLYALHAKAHSEANTQFENRNVQKTYQAVSEIQGSLDPRTGQWMDWKCKVLRGKKRTYESPHGQISWTQALCEGQFGENLHWTLRPVTGRSHQLRFDLSRHGFPVQGDSLYGAKPLLENEISLRSTSLEFKDATWAKKFNLPTVLTTSPLF